MGWKFVSIKFKQHKKMNQSTFFLRAIFIAVVSLMVSATAKAANTCGMAQILNVSLGEQSFQVTTTNANDNATSGATLCGTSVDNGGQHWFRFTWNECNAANVILTTQIGLTNFDTKLHVYTGSCGNFTCVIGDDDSGDGTDSYVQFLATPGTTYFIRLGGFGAAQGTATLTFDPQIGGCLDPEACNYNAAAEFDDCSCCYGVCAQFTLLDNGTQGPGSYAIIQANDVNIGYYYVGETYNICLPPTCNITIFFIVDNEVVGWQGTDYLLVAEGEPYFGEVPAPFWFDESFVNITFENCGCMDPLADNYDPNYIIDNGDCLYLDENYSCQTAIPHDIGSLVSVDTENGQISIVNQGDCMSGIPIRDVWYSFLYEGGAIMFDAIAGYYSMADPVLYVYGDCESFAIECNDDDVGAATLNSRISLSCADGLVNGQTYYVRLGSLGHENTGIVALRTHLIDVTGCTDLLAVNYSNCANLDDNSCIYESPSCNGDLDFNGNINVGDLLIFLTLYGTSCN